MSGKVYLVGAGPGEKDLITVKGKRLLEACSVVVYDSLVSEQLLWSVKEDCERIYVGKRNGKHSAEQQEINAVLVEKALAGKMVVRLKGGDPFVFGRGGEEIEALRKAGISYETVPGVTSAVSVPASAGIPVTHRGLSQSLHIVTGHTAASASQLTDNYEALAKAGGTAVFLMGLSNLGKITQEMVKYGKPGETPAAVITSGTTNQQRVLRSTLSRIAKEAEREQMDSPAVIVIGETAALDYRCQKKGRLSGISVGVTGTFRFTQKLISLLEAEGAAVRLLFQMQLKEINQERFLAELTDVESYSWVVFTNSNAVSLFFQQQKKLGMDYRRFSHLKFAVIGAGTGKTLLEYGFHTDFMPAVYTAAALGAGLAEIADGTDRFLIPRAAAGSKELTKKLKEAQLSYTDLPVYELTLKTIEWENLEKEAALLDYITFGSSSGVRVLLEQEGLKKILMKKSLAAIGEITANTIKSFGYGNPVTAEDYTAEGLVSAICQDVCTMDKFKEEKGEPD